MALIGSVSGSHTKLKDGTTYIEAGSNITIVSGSGDSITITGTDTTYTAGDGLDLSGTAFSTDLKSGGGLKIDTTELAVEVNDFAGTGLEDDGSDNLRISSAAAGNGLTGGAGSALAVGAGTGISVASTTVGVDNTVVATLSGSQFSGNVGVTGSISASGQLSGSSVFVDILSGSLTTLTDGRPLILGAGATSVSSGSPDKPGQITISSVDTNYTAGDGLDLSGTSFSTDLKTAGGLKIDSTELAIDHSVVATISGSTFTGAVKFNSGLSGSLTHLADGSPLIIGGANITISSASGENITIAGSGDTTYTAGDGLDLSGNAFSTDLKAGSGLVIDTTELSIDHAIIPATSGAIFSGDVGVTGSISNTGHAEIGGNLIVTGALEVGGGFGSTGATITGAGAIMANGSVKVGGGAIQDNAGNNNILISGGNTTVTGDLTANTGIKISSNALTASDGGKPIIWDTSDNVTIAGDLTVMGNDIKDSGGNVAIAFDGSGNIVNDVTFKSVAGGTTFPTISLESTDLSANDSSELRFKKYDTAIADTSLMGEIYFMAGEVEGSYYSAAGIAGSCDGNWIDGSSRPGKLNFYTTGENSTSLTNRMTVNEHGDVDILKNLYVTGDISASGSINASFSDLTLSGDLAVNGGDITSTGDTTLTPAGGQVFIKGDLYVVDGDSADYIARIYDSSDDGVFQLYQNNSVTAQIYAAGNSYVTNGFSVGENNSNAQLWVTDDNTGTSSSDYGMVFENTQASATGARRIFNIRYEANNLDTADYAIRAHSNGTSTLEWYIRADGVSDITLTGQHWVVFVADTNSANAAGDMSSEIEPGMIVESTGEIWLRRNLQDTIPKVKKSSTANSKTVFGVMASDYNCGFDLGYWNHYNGTMNTASIVPEDSEVDDLMNYSDSSTEFKCRINSIGEGGIWITNISGNVENGDYITSSPIAGYGQLQSDDLLHNYTVAKCTETVDWNSVTDTIEHAGQTYKKYLAGCTYHCG